MDRSWNDAGERRLTVAAAGMACLAAGFAIAMHAGDGSRTSITGLLRLPDEAVGRPVDQAADDGFGAADTLITGSTSGLGTGSAARRYGMAAAARAASYRVVAVADGRAWLQAGRGGGSALIAVERGSLLPGAGRVLAIETSAGRWIVETTRITITSGIVP